MSLTPPLPRIILQNIETLSRNFSTWISFYYCDHVAWHATVQAKERDLFHRIGLQKIPIARYDEGDPSCHLGASLAVECCLRDSFLPFFWRGKCI